MEVGMYGIYIHIHNAYDLSTFGLSACCQGAHHHIQARIQTFPHSPFPFQNVILLKLISYVMHTNTKLEDFMQKLESDQANIRFTLAAVTLTDFNPKSNQNQLLASGKNNFANPTVPKMTPFKIPQL